MGHKTVVNDNKCSDGSMHGSVSNLPQFSDRPKVTLPIRIRTKNNICPVIKNLFVTSFGFKSMMVLLYNDNILIVHMSVYREIGLFSHLTCKVSFKVSLVSQADDLKNIYFNIFIILRCSVFVNFKSFSFYFHC